MYFSIAFAVLAQSLAASAATMQVTVGANNQLTFTPKSITAQPGDQVAFNFVSANHSVVSANANAPCTPQANAIFSNFQPVGNTKTAATGKGTGKKAGAKNNKRAAANPTFTVPITDSDPIYIYCSQAQHCQSGMVMVINPPNAQAVTQFAQKAAQAKTNTSPRGGVSGGMVTNSQAGTAKAAAGGAGNAQAKGTGKGSANAGKAN